jgi:uncharacterized protein (TIGR03790 family)
MLLLLLFALPLFAAGPDNVLLVVNTNSPLSLRLGEFYTNWHKLKPEQICRISTATTETVTRSVYDNEIANRIGACLTRTRRVEQTFYLVVTKGLPLRVSQQQQGDWKLTDGAAVDSELTLLYAKLKGTSPNLAGSLANPFMGRMNEPFAHPAFPIYLVTRLAGYTYEDTIRSIQRCRGARNTGKVVLDLKEDSDQPGDDWLRTASILLPAARVQVDTSTKVIPSATAVIGYASWGSNDKNRVSRKSGMQWLPGAIATEYVSSSLRTQEAPPPTWQLGKWNDSKTFFAGTPQSMILDYIAEGASGVAGAVDEPYLAFTTRPNFLFPAYLSGRNLAESFFLAMPALSWYFIVIGDPLCSLQ